MSVSRLLTDGSYTGDAVTTTFAVPAFDFQTNSQIKVSVDGVVQTISTDYTLTGSPATAVEFNTAPASAAVVRIYRLTPLTQTLDLLENAVNPEEDKEKAYDRLCMMIQELEARVAALEV